MPEHPACVAPCRHRGAPPPRGAGGHTSRALTAPRPSIILRWPGRPGRVRCSRGSACLPFSPRIPSQAREDMQVYELLSGIRPQHRTTSGPTTGLVFSCGERSAKLGAMSDSATHTIQTRAPRRSLKFPGLVRTRTRSNPDRLHFQKKVDDQRTKLLRDPKLRWAPRAAQTRLPPPEVSRVRRAEVWSSRALRSCYRIRSATTIPNTAHSLAASAVDHAGRRPVLGEAQAGRRERGLHPA